jgi:hypothetical protein
LTRIDAGGGGCPNKCVSISFLLHRQAVPYLGLAHLGSTPFSGGGTPALAGAIYETVGGAATAAWAQVIALVAAEHGAKYQPAEYPRSVTVAQAGLLRGPGGGAHWNEGLLAAGHREELLLLHSQKQATIASNSMKRLSAIICGMAGVRLALDLRADSDR